MAGGRKTANTRGRKSVWSRIPVSLLNCVFAWRASNPLTERFADCRRWPAFGAALGGQCTGRRVGAGCTPPGFHAQHSSFEADVRARVRRCAPLSGAR